MKIAQAILIALILLSACTKPATNPVSDMPSATFANKTGKPIIVRYWEDGGKPYYLRIKPNEKGLIAGSNKKIYYYWATDDFTMSNWYLRNTIDTPAVISLKEGHQNTDINPVRKTIDMLYVLRGIDGPTEWVAIDLKHYATGESIWHTLSQNDKNKRVIINPDYKLVYVNRGKEELHKIWVFDSNESFINISAIDSANNRSMHLHNSTPGDFDGYYRRDTLSLTLYQDTFNYLLIRKKL